MEEGRRTVANATSADLEVQVNSGCRYRGLHGGRHELGRNSLK